MEENTSGVVFIQIRDTKKKVWVSKAQTPSIMDKFSNPVGAFYSNWGKFQDFYHDNLLDHANGWLEGRLHQVNFEYVPNGPEERVSLSWHLTTKEKQQLAKAVNKKGNKKSLQQLKNLIE